MKFIVYFLSPTTHTGLTATILDSTDKEYPIVSDTHNE
jgi:hypothetical protein